MIIPRHPYRQRPLSCHEKLVFSRRIWIEGWQKDCGYQYNSKMLGVDQLGTFTNGFLVSRGAKVEGQTRYSEARRRYSLGG